VWHQRARAIHQTGNHLIALNDAKISLQQSKEEITMTTHFSRLYDTHMEAQRVLLDLRSAGVPEEDISLIANGGDRSQIVPDATDGVSTGAGIGAALGGGAGLLAGLGVIAIPGVGPIITAGWLAATLTGMVAGGVAGAAAGGIVEILVGSGVDESDAHVYAESIRQGGSLIVVRTDELRRAVAETVLDKHPSVTISDRRSQYESEGWEGFDEKQGPYTRPDHPGSRPTPISML
jgi:hypothetical protein